jgi:hypothetical protein
VCPHARKNHVYRTARNLLDHSSRLSGHGDLSGELEKFNFVIVNLEQNVRYNWISRNALGRGTNIKQRRVEITDSEIPVTLTRAYIPLYRVTESMI